MVVTSERFAKLEENRVPVDDVFLHRWVGGIVVFLVAL